MNQIQIHENNITSNQLQRNEKKFFFGIIRNSHFSWWFRIREVFFFFGEID